MFDIDITNKHKTADGRIVSELTMSVDDDGTLCLEGLVGLSCVKNKWRVNGLDFGGERHRDLVPVPPEITLIDVTAISIDFTKEYQTRDGRKVSHLVESSSFRDGKPVLRGMVHHTNGLKTNRYWTYDGMHIHKSAHLALVLAPHKAPSAAPVDASQPEPARSPEAEAFYLDFKAIFSAKLATSKGPK